MSSFFFERELQQQQILIVAMWACETFAEDDNSYCNPPRMGKPEVEFTSFKSSLSLKSSREAFDQEIEKYIKETEYMYRPAASGPPDRILIIQNDKVIKQF